MSGAGVEIRPTLEGCVNGIIARSQDERGRNVYTLQCQHCGATETPSIMVLMNFKFNPLRDPKNGRLRLCPDCRMASYVDQGFTEAQIRIAQESGG